jgi:hypothetical protein
VRGCIATKCWPTTCSAERRWWWSLDFALLLSNVPPCWDSQIWEPGALWGDHNYLGSELNVTRADFADAFNKLPDGDKKIYFSDLVDKMNPNGAMVIYRVMFVLVL